MNNMQNLINICLTIFMTLIIINIQKLNDQLESHNHAFERYIDNIEDIEIIGDFYESLDERITKLETEVSEK